MSKAPDPSALPLDPDAVARDALARLRAIAGAIEDYEFGDRLKRIYEAGTRAIGALHDIDLSRFEESPESGAPDLSLWEAVAPVVADTLVEVNGLLAMVRELFPLSESSAGGAHGLAARKAEATLQLQLGAHRLTGDVAALGERVRSPQVVSDRWNLIREIQEFRGKLRASVGEMLFQSALTFESVSREEVVPGYAAEVKQAVAGRRAVTDLARLVAAYRARAADAAGQVAGRVVVELARDLGAFTSTRAYLALRAPDKRHFVEFRQRLARFAERPDTAPEQIIEAIRLFAGFARSLSRINQRACLQEHDRQVFAACSVKLETADAVKTTRPEEAARLLGEAVEVAGQLYGRAPSLDAFLRKARRRDLSESRDTALEFEIELLRGLVAAAMADGEPKSAGG